MYKMRNTINEKVKSKNEYLIISICMVVVELFYLGNIFREIPLHTTSDELGAMIAPAYLAGRNWEGVVSHSGYYGFGFFFFFFWIFKITSNPILIYRTILVACSIQKILTIPISYYLCKKYFLISNKKLCIILAVLMPFLHTSRVITVSNEYGIELIVWLDLLIVLKIIEYRNNIKRKSFFTFLLILLLAYSQTIHTRMLVLVIANIIVMVLVNIRSKNKLKSFAYFILFLGLFKIVDFVINDYQKNVWSGNAILRNASVEVSKNLNIFSSDTWAVWGHMLLGMMNTMVLAFGGIFLFAAIVFIFYLYIRMSKKISLQNSSFALNADTVLTIVILCMGATVLAFLFSAWAEGILKGWSGRGKAGEYFYFFKGLTYIRYWEPYVAPFFLVTCSLIYHKIINVKQIISTTVICYIIFQILFINKIIPLIEDNANPLGPLRGFSLYKIDDIVSRKHYITSVLIVSGIFILWVFLSVLKKYYISLIIVLLAMVYQYQYSVEYYDLPIQDKMSCMIDASYNKILELEKQGYELEKIYVVDTRETIDNNWKIYSVAQFYLNRYTLWEGQPEYLKENEIIISNSNLKNTEGMMCLKLDSNEYWYVSKNDKFIRGI